MNSPAFPRQLNSDLIQAATANINETADGAQSQQLQNLFIGGENQSSQHASLDKYLLG